MGEGFSDRDFDSSVGRDDGGSDTSGGGGTAGGSAGGDDDGDVNLRADIEAGEGRFDTSTGFESSDPEPRSPPPSDTSDDGPAAGPKIEDVDGRKTKILGEDNPANPTDDPLAVVQDRAGDEGQRVFSEGDDPFVPDADAPGVEDRAGQLAGPGPDVNDPLDDAVSRLEADISRATGRDIISPETSAFNIRRRGGRLDAELTDEGLRETGVGPAAVGGMRTVFQEPAASQDSRRDLQTDIEAGPRRQGQSERRTGAAPLANRDPAADDPVEALTDDTERGTRATSGRDELSADTEAGDRVEDPDRPADVRARQQVLRQAGLVSVDGAAQFVDVEREGNQVRAQLTSAGQRRAARQQAAAELGVPMEQVSVERTGEGQFRAEVTGDASGGLDLSREGGRPDEVSELFGPDRAPEQNTGDPTTEFIQEPGRPSGALAVAPPVAAARALEAPEENEVVADLRAIAGVPNRDLEADISAEATQAITERTGVNPRAARERAARQIRGEASEFVDQARDQPLRTAAAALPAAAAEPTFLGEAGIAAGTIAGLVGADIATGQNRDQPTSPLSGEELPAPQQPPGQQTEIEVPEQATVEAGELGVPEEGQPGEIDVPERPIERSGEVDIPDQQERVDPTDIQASSAVTEGEVGPTGPGGPTLPEQPAEPDLPGFPDPTEDIVENVDRDQFVDRPEGGVRTFGEQEPEVSPDEGVDARDFQQEIEQDLADLQGATGVGSGARGLPSDLAVELGLADEAPATVRARPREEAVSRGESLRTPDSVGDATPGLDARVGVRTGTTGSFGEQTIEEDLVVDEFGEETVTDEFIEDGTPTDGTPTTRVPTRLPDLPEGGSGPAGGRGRGPAAEDIFSSGIRGVPESFGRSSEPRQEEERRDDEDDEFGGIFSLL